MSGRKRPSGPAHTPTRPHLTDVGKCGNMYGRMEGLYRPCAMADTPPGTLSDSDWTELVEQLLRLMPEDFEAAVAAVRLQRRLERR